MNKTRPLAMLILYCFIASCLVACGPIKNDPVPTKTEYTGLARSLFKNCDITEPPPKNKYKGASAEDKEKLLAKYADDLLADLAKCNGRINGISEANDRKTKLMNDTDTKGK